MITLSWSGRFKHMRQRTEPLAFGQTPTRKNFKLIDRFRSAKPPSQRPVCDPQMHVGPECKPITRAVLPLSHERTPHVQKNFGFKKNWICFKIGPYCQKSDSRYEVTPRMRVSVFKDQHTLGFSFSPDDRAWKYGRTRRTPSSSKILGEICDPSAESVSNFR